MGALLTLVAVGLVALWGAVALATGDADGSQTWESWPELPPEDPSPEFQAALRTYTERMARETIERGGAA